MNKLEIWDVVTDPEKKVKIIRDKKGSLWVESCFYLFSRDRQSHALLRHWELYIKTSDKGDAVPVGFVNVNYWKNDLLDLLGLFI